MPEMIAPIAAPTAAPTTAAPVPSATPTAPTQNPQTGIAPTALAPVALQSTPIPDLYGEQVKPADYDFRQEGIPNELRMPMDQQIELRNLLASEGMPKSLVSEIAVRWNHASKAPPQSDADLTLGMHQAQAQIEAVYGARADETIRLARDEAKRMMKKSPAIKAMLENTALGNDVWLIGTLANLAMVRMKKGL